MKSITIGMDLGDKKSVVCEMNDLGDIIGTILSRLGAIQKSDIT